MNLFTYTSLKTKLQNDMDVEDLDFLDGETELLGYINEAIDDAESIVHTLGLDATYFLAQSTIALVSGTADYALPSNIYANKIKKIFYINGNTKYEVFRVRDLREVPEFQAGDDYKYVLLTTTGTANNMRIRFFPTPAETNSNIQIWYIRNCAEMTTSSASTNVCEIPECANLVMRHVKTRIYEKMSHPNYAASVQELEAQKQLLMDTLREMVPDENTVIEPDLSHYEDSYINYRGNY